MCPRVYWLYLKTRSFFYTLAFLFCWTSSIAKAQNPELFFDSETLPNTILQTDVSSTYSVGTVIFFAAYDPEHGVELWKSDGTDAGTELYADVVPGPTSSKPRNIFGIGGLVFFTATAEDTGEELYVADISTGTASLVKDINPGPESSFISGRKESFGGEMYFAAQNASHGRELWKSDGTPAGTIRLTDGMAGPEGSTPSIIGQASGELRFSLRTSAEGAELWSTDGTIPGTGLWTDINPGMDSSSPGGVSILNSVAFAADDGSNGRELWVSNSVITSMILNINPTGSSFPGTFTAGNSLLYFTAVLPVTGRELWVSNGSAIGTVPSKEFAVGSFDSDLRIYRTIGDTLLFRATTQTEGAEVWRTISGGTDAQIVSDIIPGAASSGPDSFGVLGSKFYFYAYTDAAGYELYVTDGTPAGTMLKEINPGPVNSGPITVDQGVVSIDAIPHVIAATDELNFWEIPATGAPIKKASLSLGDGSTMGYKSFLRLGGNAPSGYCILTDTITMGETLWCAENMEATPEIITTNFRVRDLIAPSFLNGDFLLSGQVDLRGGATSTGDELYRYSNATGEVSLVKDINTDFFNSHRPEGSRPYNFVELNGKVFFTASSPGATAANDLYETDGTNAGTQPMMDFYPGGNDGVGDLRLFKGMLFFSAWDTASMARQPYLSNGTPGGTQILKSIQTSTASTNIQVLGEYDSLLYFVAKDDLNGVEVWQTDGTEGGTVRVSDFNPGPADSNIQQMIKIGNTLFFQANDGTTGRELWKIEGGTQTLIDIEPGPNDSDPTNFNEVDGLLYFTAYTDAVGQEVWRSDGTAAGTFPVTDQYPAGEFGDMSDLTAVGSLLYFLDAVENYEMELFRTDGTFAGTERVAPDLYNIDSLSGSDLESSNENFPAMNVVGSNLYVSLNSNQYGQEVFRITDECPASIPEYQAGACGCGVIEVDDNGNGTFDCLTNDELRALIGEILKELKRLKLVPSSASKKKKTRAKARAKLIRKLLKALNVYFKNNKDNVTTKRSKKKFLKPFKQGRKFARKATRFGNAFKDNKKNAIRGFKKARRQLE